MSELVPEEEIEGIVGCRREEALHIGRLEMYPWRFYIMHSAECKATTPDLRECGFSKALDDAMSCGFDDGTPLMDWLDTVGFAPAPIEIVDGKISGLTDGRYPWHNDSAEQEASHE